MKRITLTPARFEIRDFSRENTDILQLYGIYRETIDPTLDFDSFLNLYISENLISIDFTLFTHKSSRAGFSAAFFYEAEIKGRSCYVARSATALAEAFQGQGLHDQFNLYWKFILFAIKNRDKPLWVGVYVVNAFVYSELCKLVPKLFPKPGKSVPENFEHIMDEMIRDNGHERNERYPYAVTVPIQVKFNEKLLARIYESDDLNVQWYLKNNPAFLDKHALLTVIHVSRWNVQGTVLNFIKHYCIKKTHWFCGLVKRPARAQKQKLITLVETVLRKWIL